MDLKTYFQAYQDYFWEWEDQAQYLVVPNGHTIAFRDFAIQVIEDLADQGIPPFGALLLAIIATNSSGLDDLALIEELFLEKFEQQDNLQAMGALMLQNSMPFLKLLANLPEDYKTGDKRRQVFFTLFLDAHNRLSAKKAKALLADYQENKADFHNLLYYSNPFYSQLFYKDFRIFELLNNKYPTQEDFLNALKSIPSIEEEVLEEVLEQDSPFDPDAFVQELTDDAKTFHVGALLKRVWSGLNIPFQNLMPSEQPLGGISDLTNKGTFDRLLISEFAYDDLSFLSRLANNEALYLHREAPPDANHLERVILVDQSLKNWGSPKLIAFAVMLAVARHPKASSNCQAFGLGDTVHPIAFDTKDQIIHSLFRVSDALDCSKGIETFFKEYPSNNKTEAIFISSEDATNSAVMQKVLNAYRQQFKYWINVNADGQIRLYKNQPSGRKFVQTIQLPLEELWKKEKAPQPKQSKTPQPGNYPILFPRTLNPKRLLSTSNEQFFVVTGEKNLMRFYDNKFNRNNKGWDLLYEKLPVSSGAYEIGISSSGDYLFLAFNVQNRALTLINLSTGRERSFFFTDWKPSRYENFLFHEDKFYYFKNRGHYILDFDIETKPPFVNEHPPELLEVYETRKEALELLNSKLWYAPPVLKNISAISISVNGHLVFNRLHHLIWNSHTGVLKFNPSGSTIETIRARTGQHRNEFKFYDGSTVHLNRSGLLTFTSSNPKIPVFYLPTVVDSALGIGTETQFSGNEYYNPSDEGHLEVVSSLHFWESIVQPFIETIQQHAT